MKVRRGFVSNSSSSSFVVAVEWDELDCESFDENKIFNLDTLEEQSSEESTEELLDSWKVEKIPISVMCVDNNGLENHFEKNIVYPLIGILNSKKTYVVENMYGVDVTVMAERFTIVE